jgi:hypothetical protein
VAGRRGRRDFGWIRQLPSGRYQASYLGPDGKRRTAPATFALKGDARTWLAGVEGEMRRGEWRDPADAEVRLSEYAGTWITQRPGLRPRTVELYRWVLGKHVTPYLGALRLADLDNNAPAIRAWRRALLDAGVSATMTAKAYRLLRAILNTAVEDETIRRNPCRIKGAGFEPSAERPTLTPAQVAALAGQCSAAVRGAGAARDVRESAVG